MPKKATGLKRNGFSTQPKAETWFCQSYHQKIPAHQDRILARLLELLYNHCAMKIDSRPAKMIALLLLVLGILLGTLLSGGLVWANLEAVFYGLPHLTNEPFDGLTCPALMTRHETAQIEVTAHNATDLPIAPMLRVSISTSYGIFSDRQQVQIAPGQSVTLKWPVSAENIDLGRFIFAKAYRYPDYKIDLGEATCGIFVVDFPLLNGAVLLALWLGSASVYTLAGLWLLEQQPERSNQRASLLAALRLLAALMFLGVLFGLQGAWLPGVLVLVLILLLTSVSLYLAFAR